MRRHELTDEQWAAIALSFPSTAATGRRAKSAHMVMNVIFWPLSIGAPGSDRRERYPWQAAYHLINTCRKDGTIDRILKALQVRLNKDGFIDWDL